MVEEPVGNGIHSVQTLVRNLQKCFLRRDDIMNNNIIIGEREIGEGNPCYLVAEIGINHNGDMKIVKDIIDIVVEAEWDAVKFQKRTINVVYTSEELATLRENPFGPTNGDLKQGLELGLEEYKEIAHHCREKGITWFASCWDEGSVDFIDQFKVPCFKIASASLTDDDLLKHTRSKGVPIILSTGMSTLEEVDHSVDVLGKENLVLMHTCSAYPSKYEDLNLKTIYTLKKRYNVPVGYSGHETGLASSIAAVAMGACILERHVTLDRAMWGSDHAASLAPSGIARFARDARLVEMSMGDGIKRVVEAEVPILKKLRIVNRKT